MISYGDYPDLSRVKKILVVKLRHLGDVLLTSPVFHVLKQACSHAQIDAYIYREAIPMLEGHPDIANVISYDRNWKKLGVLSRTLKEVLQCLEIRRKGYDLVLNLTEGDRGVLAASCSKAKVRAGFPSKGKWQNRALTHIAKHCSTPRHVVERNLDLLRRIGIFPKDSEKELYFHLFPADRDAVLSLVGPLPFILIHPTSRWRFKCWPVSQMRELVKGLLKEGKKIIVTSGPDRIEKEMADEISCGLDVLNIGGALSLKQLGALIERCEVMVCVDSVSFHIANALKKKVVALFGPTSDVTWGPWRNSKARIIAKQMSCRPCFLDGCGGSKRSACLEAISVEQVHEVVSALYEVRPKERE